MSASLEGCRRFQESKGVTCPGQAWPKALMGGTPSVAGRGGLPDDHHGNVGAPSSISMRTPTAEYMIGIKAFSERASRPVMQESGDVNPPLVSTCDSVPTDGQSLCLGGGDPSCRSGPTMVCGRGCVMVEAYGTEGMGAGQQGPGLGVNVVGGRGKERGRWPVVEADRC